MFSATSRRWAGCPVASQLHRRAACGCEMTVLQMVLYFNPRKFSHLGPSSCTHRRFPEELMQGFLKWFRGAKLRTWMGQRKVSAPHNVSKVLCARCRDWKENAHHTFKVIPNKMEKAHFTVRLCSIEMIGNSGKSIFAQIKKHTV